MKMKKANYLKNNSKIMLVKMIKNLENNMEKMQESINKRPRRIKE